MALRLAAIYFHQGIAGDDAAGRSASGLPECRTRERRQLPPPVRHKSLPAYRDRWATPFTSRRPCGGRPDAPPKWPGCARPASRGLNGPGEIIVHAAIARAPQLRSTSSPRARSTSASGTRLASRSCLSFRETVERGEHQVENDKREALLEEPSASKPQASRRVFQCETARSLTAQKFL